MPYDNRVPKRDHNVDNHLHEPGLAHYTVKSVTSQSLDCLALDTIHLRALHAQVLSFDSSADSGTILGEQWLRREAYLKYEA